MGTRSFAAVAAFLMFATSHANADLIGDTIHGDGSLQGLYTMWDTDAIVDDPQREFTFQVFPALYFADLTGDTLTIGVEWQSDNPGGTGLSDSTLEFTGLDWGLADEITGLTLISNTWPQGFGFTTTGDSITITTGAGQNAQFNANESGSIVSATWQIETAPAVIPAPGAAVLALIGIPLVGLMRRRTEA